ncbi:hypothetical protein LPU83_pLPU83d_0882 (plasmid) [Rhizobium favelukesii]|uniref:Uncharacterized protein n=1 Tax=Rhizobium favelukesii TaxID=348824 RepID=W6RM99_9HYPH|nr:hypothetical protein LPU83_pLPU83d_0882 [Rhizobium favelukesii]
MRPNARGGTSLVVPKDGFQIAGAMQNPLDTDGVVMDDVKHDVALKDS